MSNCQINQFFFYKANGKVGYPGESKTSQLGWHPIDTLCQINQSFTDGGINLLINLIVDAYVHTKMVM